MIEALIALVIVLLALVGVFDVLPYTDRTIHDDTLRAQAEAAGQDYMDGVRAAIVEGSAVPAPETIQLGTGRPASDGLARSDSPTLSLRATCEQPFGSSSLLYDCTVTLALTARGETRLLPPLESFVTRQL